MTEFKRKIVSLAIRTEATVLSEKVKKHRYSTTVRRVTEERTVYGWRLECGHVYDGQVGHGKKSMDCYYCERGTDGAHPKFLARQAAFVDVPNEPERD